MQGRPKIFNILVLYQLFSLVWMILYNTWIDYETNFLEKQAYKEKFIELSSRESKAIEPRMSTEGHSSDKLHIICCQTPISPK